MEKEDVVYIYTYTMEYYSAIENNETMPFAATWMNLEIITVYCYPAYLTYMQSTLCKMLGWMNHKLESRLVEISITSDMTKPHLWQKVKRNKRSNCQYSLDHGKNKGTPEKHLLLLH